MSPRPRRTEGRRGRTRTFVQRARFGLLACLMLLCVPVALAEVVDPPVDPNQVDPDQLGTGVSPPSDPTMLSIREGPLTVVGPADNPTSIVVQGADGSAALSYSVDPEGRARLDVAGENAVSDATFVRLEGDPTGDSFAIVLQDAEGKLHTVKVDRVALLDKAPPLDTSGLPLKAPVEVERPVGWPGAPNESYLLHVRDAGMNQLARSELEGSAWLQRTGSHRAALQIPLKDNEWDRWYVQARREGQPQTLNATFEPSHSTEGALVLFATYSPSLLSPVEGDRILIDVIYEKRVTPLIVERFPEPDTHAYRVDGRGPTVTLDAPDTSDDFRFPVSWTGADANAGIGHFVLHYRESGDTQWLPWLTTKESSAVFSGEWGASYDLRIQSFDRVGNPSAEALEATTIVGQPEGEDDVNDPPKLRFKAPLAGSELAGRVLVTWDASDPDGTPLTSRLEVSADDGETYRLLYVGPGQSATWDTTSDTDGAGYRLRLTVSDGTLSASDGLSALSLRNIVELPPPESSEPAAPSTTGGPAAPPASSGATSDGGEAVQPAQEGSAAEAAGAKDVPAPFAGLAILGAALLAARRRDAR